MTEIPPDKHSDDRDIYSVSEINRHLKQLVGSAFPLLWVEGEISNLARPTSGHIYFSLKDTNAQIRCVMFRGNQQKIPFEIKNGLQVVIRANVSLYEPRGDLQLIADQMEEAGFGTLQRQFEALKKKLFTEGLFAEQRKTSIPSFPSEIALVTSPTGAALKDFLKVIRRRYPLAKISLYAVPVQGELAADTIRSAIQAINLNKDIEVIVLIRGGGSIEDLWAFNDEQLARTIAASSIPVVTGIGHEIDYTIADFVADLRAPTPSVAAEITTPDIFILRSQVRNKTTKLIKFCRDKLNIEFQKLDWLNQRLQRIHPATNIKLQYREVRRQASRLTSAYNTYFERAGHQLKLCLTKLHSSSPTNIINKAHSNHLLLQNRLQTAIHQSLDNNRHRFQLTSATLSAISPLNTLDRGYSITIKPGTRPALIRRYEQIQAGDQLLTYLSKGQVVSRVESTSSEGVLDNFNSTDTDTD